MKFTSSSSNGMYPLCCIKYLVILTISCKLICSFKPLTLFSNNFSSILGFIFTPILSNNFKASATLFFDLFSLLLVLRFERLFLASELGLNNLTPLFSIL